MKILPVAVTALLLSGCEPGDFGPADRFQSDFHYSYDLARDARIDVETFNGSIEVTGWDEPRVDIAGTKYGSTEALLDALKIEIHHTPNSLDVRAIRPAAGNRRGGGLGARYVIRVPREARLDRITTSNGRIQARDVAGATHLTTSNGSIRAENIRGDVEARTSNSGIDVDAIRGSALLRSSNGRIHAGSVGGECDAETSNGNIHVRLESAPALPVRLITSNGGIDLTMAAAPMQDVRAETRNGGITVRLPSGTSARLVAETSNSSIHSEFDEGTERRERNNRHSRDATLGKGGPRIELATRNGPIRILKSAVDR